MRVRIADPSERPTVANVLDGAMLAVEDARLARALERGDVLLAVDADSDGANSPRVLGALVLDGTVIVAVAVRRRRRDQGIGTALVEAAAARRAHLVATFDPRVRPFWESLGFEIEPFGDAGRCRGARRADQDTETVD